MPNSDDLDNFLADMYEIFKRHEQALFELIVDVEALKSALPGAEHERFAQIRERTLSESIGQHDTQVRLLDATISRLRRT